MTPARAGGYRSLPAGVWVLGFGSLFMDISSELIHSLLPVFMATVLGASMTTIGIVEGVAEATASVTKVFSGVLSDRLRKRKFLLVLGYGLGAATKPLFPLATSVIWVFTARFIDRVGKGIRGAPRDALVADLTPPEQRGAAYGLRQSLDSVGSFLGPLLAVVFMVLLASDIRAVLWIAVIPAVVAVALLAFAVRDPATGDGKVSAPPPLTWSDAQQLSLRYWRIVLLGAVFTLARFSEAFLVLRAQDVGLAIAYVPMILIVMNVVYALSAYPAGIASDRVSRRTLLAAGLAVLVLADVILATDGSPQYVFIGAALWGLHMGLTQGLFAKLVADTAPERLRGSAFGIYNLVSGGALLLASIIAGALWQVFGAPATFTAGAAFALLTLIGLFIHNTNRPESGFAECSK
ncbi:MAG TPA: MFS transporter [Gammaproteobacteria bacterium]